MANKTSVCVTTVARLTTLAESAHDSELSSKYLRLCAVRSQTMANLTTVGGPIPATIWSVIEANNGIICTCLPVFRHPLQFYFPRLSASHKSQTATPYSRSMSLHKRRTSKFEHNLTESNNATWQDDDVEMMGPRAIILILTGSLR
jgi:phage tail protein X